MRRIFEVTLSGLVIIDDGQPDGPGKSIPSNWSAHEICQEMQDMQVHVKEMQDIRKVCVTMHQTLKEQLPLWRYRARLNGSQLSRMIGKERTWCQQVESGRNKGNLDMETCHKLAKALALNEVDLWNLIASGGESLAHDALSPE